MEHNSFEPFIEDNLAVPIATLLHESAPWLFDVWGFKIISSEYAPKSFGDSLAVLQSENLRLRWVRDRGQNMLEIAALAEPGTWWGLQSIREVITGEDPKPEDRLGMLLTTLQQLLPAIAEAFGPKLAETKMELERRKKERLCAIEKQIAIGPRKRWSS